MPLRNLSICLSSQLICLDSSPLSSPHPTYPEGFHTWNLCCAILALARCLIVCCTSPIGGGVNPRSWQKLCTDIRSPPLCFSFWGFPYFLIFQLLYNSELCFLFPKANRTLGLYPDSIHLASVWLRPALRQKARTNEKCSQVFLCFFKLGLRLMSVAIYCCQIAFCLYFGQSL